MIFPKDLVETYGAKAGLLMHVAEHLPDIPQVDMVVKTPDEPMDSFLKRADEYPILWPRLFRSSAAAEMDGFEGEFYTKEIEGFEDGRRGIVNPRYCGPYSDIEKFNDWLRFEIDAVEQSTRWLREEGHDLPERIPVIAAEKSPSSFFGTYVKHPNQDSFYLISITDSSTQNANGDGKYPHHAAYTFTQSEGVQRSKALSGFKNFEDTPIMMSDLEKVVSWHDQITSIPDMDPSWSYQIEFGIDPDVLYQVRPFKPVEKADFELPDVFTDFHRPEVVFGVTPEEGIKYTVVDVSSLWESTKHSGDRALFFGKLRSIRTYSLIPRHGANIVCHSNGILAHDDIQAMRHADVSAYFRLEPRFKEGSEVPLEHGSEVLIKSNGKRMTIEGI